MSNLYIAESGAGASELSPAAFDVRGLVEQNVTFTTAAESAVFAATTRIVRLRADAACHVEFGTGPSATTSNMPLTADTDYEFIIGPGYRVSVVQAA
jgi:hypothetical protein